MLTAEDHFTLGSERTTVSNQRYEGEWLKPLGNWPLHPSSPSRPSQEDIKLAFDSNASYMIISFMAENPVLNSFHIEKGQVEKEDLRIYSDEYYF